jgi:hypothetical protein
MFVGITGVAIGAGLVLFAPDEPSAAEPNSVDATLVRVAAIILGLVELAFGAYVLVRFSAVMRRLERRYAAVRAPTLEETTEANVESDGDARAVPPRPSVVASIAIIALGMSVATLMIGFRL